MYFTGFPSSAGTVVITPQRAVLLIDFRYFEKAKASIEHLEVILAVKTSEQMKEIFEKEEISLIFVETDRISLNSYKGLCKAFPDITLSKKAKLSNEILKLRSIKSDSELNAIKQAQSLTDKAFEHILDFIKSGKTEKEIMLEMEFFIRKIGSEGAAFDFIVVSGKNSSLPHGVPTEKAIENGDFITMDFGAVVSGYRSDMTRTVAIGYADEEMREVYNTVLSAQTEALKAIKPNVKCRDIDKIARDIISSKGYGECFGHGLGHSVGLEIHESPCFNIRDNTLLKEGMVLTVEPGIYIEDKFGVRIEDMVYITDDSYENITGSPKELIVL